jgi:Ca-activated chloride channel family protein
MEAAMMEFAKPIWLGVCLLVLPVLFLLYWRRERRIHSAIRILCAPRLQQKNVLFSLSRERLRSALALLAVGCALVALARPQAGVEVVQVSRSSEATLFLLDVSRSMLADDVRPNRLERARIFAMDWMAKNPGMEVGLAVFAGEGRLLSPPTFDHALIKEMLREANPDSVAVGGTNMENALNEALAIMGALPHRDKSVILLSDGEDLEGVPGRVLGSFAEHGIQLHTAVFGTTEGSLIPIETNRGGTAFVLDPAGRRVTSRAQPELMQTWAETTGGQLLTDAQVMKVPREEDAQGRQEIRITQDWSWLLAAAAFFFALTSLLIGRRPGKMAT